MPDLIRPFDDADLDAVVALSLRAWAPVFGSLEAALGPRVFRLLFPDWRVAQAKAVEATCKAGENDSWVAVRGDRPVGFVSFGLIDEDAARAGEIHMIAVDPDHQGAGVGRSLMQHAIKQIRAVPVVGPHRARRCRP